MKDIYIRCDRCGQDFLGEEWMLNSNKEITCRNCWRDSMDDDDYEDYKDNKNKERQNGDY